MGVCKPQKISRELYERVKSDGMARKAIAALLMVRKLHSSSAITRYTHRKFAHMIGVHPTTAKTYFLKLEKLGLVMRCDNGTVAFKSTCGKTKNNRWHRHCNIYLDKFCFSSIAAIESCMFTQEIMEIQNRKDFLMHASNNAQKPKPNAKAKAIKAAQKVWNKVASEEFSDGGISTRYLRKRLHTSTNRITEAIRQGEAKHIFKVKRGVNPLLFLSKSCDTPIFYSCNLFSLVK
ncbi:MAG: hypothetical protein PHR41_09070 [Lactococcus chungangensis]|nr:hypothetical protein [Lactococcus chungangensis]